MYVYKQERSFTKFIFVIVTIERNKTFTYS